MPTRHLRLTQSTTIRIVRVDCVKPEEEVLANVKPWTFSPSEIDFATWLDDADGDMREGILRGRDPEAVARRARASAWLGHTDSAFTGRIYGQRTEDSSVAQADARRLFAVA